MKYPDIYSMHLDYVGRLNCFGGNVSIGRDLFLKSVKIKPFQKSGYMNLILSGISPELHKKWLSKNTFRVDDNGIGIYK